MNEFTKTELESIIDAFKYIREDPAWREGRGWDDELERKIQYLIDNYFDKNEKEIYSCYTGIGVSDEFFLNSEAMTAHDLLAAFHELNNKCDGIIKKAGIYALKVKLVKLK